MIGILYVFVGGGLGSICRYSFSLWLSKGTAVYGTLASNIISCLILGILIGLNHKNLLSSENKLLFMTGFCGGFSTFSTFSAEIVEYAQSGMSLHAIGYILISLFTGIASILLGITLGKMVLP